MMKKLSKILLVMALTLTVFFAMMAVASAATIESVEATVAPGEGRAITVTVEYGSPEPAQQSTVLVVKSGVAIGSGLADSDIKYIDQEAVSDTAVAYTFRLLEADRTGTYDVYVGGTGVDAPESTSFSFDKKKLIGTITLVEGAKAEKATAIATAADGTVINGSVASTGAYEIEVGEGTYTVVLGKAGYLYKTYESVTPDAPEYSLGAVTLMGGDFNADSIVDLEDLQTILTNYNGNLESLDLDDSGVIDLVELQNTLTNYNKKVSDYE